MRKVLCYEVPKNLSNEWSKADIKYMMLFNERTFSGNMEGVICLPDEWDVETLIEKLKFCVEHKVPLETFPEWQKYKREKEIEDAEFLKGLEDCDWD